MLFPNRLNHFENYALGSLEFFKVSLKPNTPLGGLTIFNIIILTRFLSDIICFNNNFETTISFSKYLNQNQN